jgi:hypothetical protein
MRTNLFCQKTGRPLDSGHADWFGIEIRVWQIEISIVSGSFEPPADGYFQEGMRCRARAKRAGARFVSAKTQATEVVRDVPAREFT